MQPVASKYSQRSITTFSPEEIKVIIDTAHRLGVKVAAHSSVDESIKVLIECGVDSIEHGYDMSDETLDALAKSPTVWVPTLAAYYTLGSDPNSSRSPIWETAQRTFKAEFFHALHTWAHRAASESSQNARMLSRIS